MSKAFLSGNEAFAEGVRLSKPHIEKGGEYVNFVGLGVNADE